MTLPENYELPSACDTVKDMTTWLQEETPGAGMCRPCILPIGVGWYIHELEANGKADLAQVLKSLADNETITPLEVAKQLDSIKSRVDPRLGLRLKELDCTLQINADVDPDDLEDDGEDSAL